MTTSKNGRLLYGHRWTLGSRGRAENEPITNKCVENEPITNEWAENYQQIPNEWSLGTRGWAQHYFVDIIFVENNAAVVVRKKQHGRESNTITLALHYSRQDHLLNS